MSDFVDFQCLIGSETVSQTHKISGPFGSEREACCGRGLNQSPIQSMAFNFGDIVALIHCFQID